jgi:hypothetical protein
MTDPGGSPPSPPPPPAAGAHQEAAGPAHSPGTVPLPSPMLPPSPMLAPSPMQVPSAPSPSTLLPAPSRPLPGAAPLPGPPAPPAEYTAEPAASAGWPPVPDQRVRPPVPSRPGKKLLSTSIGIGVIILIAAFAIYFRLAAPGPAAQRSTIAAAPGTSPPTLSSSAPAPSAPATPSTTPVPRISAARWLHGLRLLQTHMNNTEPGTSGIVTPAYLQSQARQLRRCSPELAGLGPPVARLEPASRLAAQACGEFGQAASCYAGAATTFDPSDVTAQFDNQLNCGDTDATSGSELIGEAVAIGSSSQTAS